MNNIFELSMGRVLDKIMDYEAGHLSNEEIISLFQELVDSGLAGQLQGSYGRTAATLIKRGLVHPKKGGTK